MIARLVPDRVESLQLDSPDLVAIDRSVIVQRSSDRCHLPDGICRARRCRDVSDAQVDRAAVPTAGRVVRTRLLCADGRDRVEGVYQNEPGAMTFTQ